MFDNLPPYFITLWTKMEESFVFCTKLRFPFSFFDILISCSSKRFDIKLLRSTFLRLGYLVIRVEYLVWYYQRVWLFRSYPFRPLDFRWRHWAFQFIALCTDWRKLYRHHCAFMRSHDNPLEYYGPTTKLGHYFTRSYW